ncbi:hypothetical protein LXL04_022286 [Taraxacum kok-saghyz]
MLTSVIAGTTMKLAKLNTNTVMKRWPSPDDMTVFSVMVVALDPVRKNFLVRRLTTTERKTVKSHREDRRQGTIGLPEKATPPVTVRWIQETENRGENRGIGELPLIWTPAVASCFDSSSVLTETEMMMKTKKKGGRDGDDDEEEEERRSDPLLIPVVPPSSVRISREDEEERRFTRSGRESKFPSSFDDFFVEGKHNSFDDFFFEGKQRYGIEHNTLESQTFDETAFNPNWIKAMNDELEAFYRNHTWYITNLLVVKGSLRLNINQMEK